MSKEHDRKTNAMRVLDAAGTPYEARFFDCPEAVSGVEVARILELDPDTVFKTLVTRGKSGEHYVFMIPVACELDLKKAAAVVGEKAVAMIRSRELLGLDRLCARGLLAAGHAEALPHRHRRDVPAARAHRVLGRAHRLPDRDAPDDLARAVPLAVADLTVV